MKKIPEFKSEAEEFEFWSTADSTEYLDWARAKYANPVNLKPRLVMEKDNDVGGPENV